MSNFEAVILDMDGVITRTVPLHAEAWKRMFDEYLQRRGEREGRSYAPFDKQAEYRRYVDGKPRYDGVRSFLAARGLQLPEGGSEDPPEAETIRGLGNRKNQLLHELLQREGVEVYEDAVQRVQGWRAEGMKVGLITSSRNAGAVLEAAGLGGWFDVQVDGHDLQRMKLDGKPAPDMFLYAARRLNVEPARSIVVEDAIAGVQAGRAGGFGLVVGVARQGEGREELARQGADVVVEDLGQLEVPPSGAGR